MVSRRTFVTLTLILVLIIIAFFSLAEMGAEESKTTPQVLSDRPSPGDWIVQEQIKVYNNKIVIDLKNASWAKLTDTNSMDPLLDATANVLEVHPLTSEEIQMGDVISYKTPYGLVLHRVIEKKADEKGIYFIAKGDNNVFSDPTKIRLEDINGVVVAVFY